MRRLGTTADASATHAARLQGAGESALRRLVTAVAAPVVRGLSDIAVPDAEPRPGQAATVRLAQPARAVARTPLERLAVAVLEAEVDVPFGVLVARVAEALYADALRDGAGAAELRLLGPWLFHPEVRREILAGAGSLWTIDDRTRQPIAPRAWR